MATHLLAEHGKIYPVHRLDKETSGVMVFARNAAAHRTLDRQFSARTVEKIYHAICLGVAAWEEMEIDAPLRVNGDRMHRTILDADTGKPARTLLRTLRRFALLTLLEARPQTGYTHQIRAHLSSAGFPLLGDRLYRYLRSYKGVQPDPSLLPPFQRTALHAWEVSFAHPVSGERLRFHASYPPDFADLLNSLVG
jgi:RluA family pseudouridine synthase